MVIVLLILLPLGILLAIRLLLILGILYDLTAFQGKYIDLLVNGITPDISPLVGALLLDDLHSQSLVFAARYQIPIPERLPIWRQNAMNVYRGLIPDLSNESPWAVWVTLRLAWPSPPSRA